MLANNAVFKLFKNGASAEMNVDGGTPVHFDYVAPANKTVWVQRINFILLDGSMTNDKFAGLAALTNGLLIRHFDANDNLVMDFLDGLTIKQNVDFGLLAGPDVPIAQATGDEALIVRWTLARALIPDGLQGYPLKEGEYIRITVQDNLSAITKFRAMLQGEADPDLIA